MPTKEYSKLFYNKFGIDKYHSQGVFGQNVSIYLIDTGLTSTCKLKNVKSRTVANAMAPQGHGSFVANIVAAQASESGAPGIAPEAQVYLSDITGADGKIYTSYLIKAIEDAIDLQVDIISISMGTSVYNQKLEDCVRKAAAQGTLVFAATGNCSCRTYEFPSACDAAISVASMDANRKPSQFNTRNDSVAVFAPGQNIGVPGAPKPLSGTSFAVPFVSGLAALELSKRRLTEPGARMSRDEAIAMLRTTLGLDCSIHTYSNDSCAGRFGGGAFVPEGSDGLSWFLLLACSSGALAVWASAYYTAKLGLPKCVP